MTSRRAGPREELRAGIEAITGHAPTPAVLNHFEQYLALFLQWNRTHRMTALDSPQAIVHDLLLDSLLFLRFLPSPQVRIVDIGAGAGIPGLPLKLLEPRISLTLIEARRKRVSFLLAACRELELEDVQVHEGRAEGLVATNAGLADGFDVVVSRAVGAASGLFDVARKYLKLGGLFVATGPPGASVYSPFRATRVAVPGSKRARTFVTALKES